VELLEGLDPLQPQVLIVLPGVSDAAEQLDRLAAYEATRRSGPRLGDRSEIAGVELATLLGPRCAEHSRAGALGLDQHVGRAVLQRLERADRHTEGLALGRVGDGRFERRLHAAEHHRRGAECTQLRHAREHAVGGSALGDERALVSEVDGAEAL
jgi:hypothetical protein